MRRAAILVVLALGVLATPGPAAAQSSELVGTFRLTAGGCGGGVAGSWFRMVYPTGNPGDGPYVTNADSSCSDQSYTLLGPGRDGGLVSGRFQPEPSPGFDANGNSVANALTTPARFFGILFSTSTNEVDPQTGRTNAVPRITANGGSLSGDLSAFAASWNNQEFNQGGPATGTYDAATGAFTLEWTSTIVDGPFDKFTGLWHLEGTFVPASSGGGSTATTAAPAGGGGGSATTAAPGVTSAAGGTVPGGTTATTAPSSSGSSPQATTGVAAPTPASRTAASTTDADEGWAPPAWLVVVIALLGLAGFAFYIGLDRAVGKIEAAP